MPDAPKTAPIPTIGPPHPALSRRRLLLRLGGTGAALVGGTAAYSAAYAPFHPVVERVDVPIKGLPEAFEGVRIALLSDLHVQPNFPASCLAPAIEAVLQEKPDLIFLLGDYINSQDSDKLRHLTDCAHALRPLTAPLGVYAIFGNHDFPPPPDNPPTAMWEEIGVKTLCNAVAEVTRGGDALYLCGLPSLLARPAYPADLLTPLPPTATKIVLWHEPDRAPESALFGASLQVSGHTHGGQVVIPGFGPPLLPIGGKRFAAGRYRVGKMPLYVTRGVGLLPPLVRFNCPAEVTILTLQAAAPHL